MSENSEMKQFIVQVLSDIIQGVCECQSTAVETKAIVVPTGLNINRSCLSTPLYKDDGNLATVVEFDIALTVETSNSRSGKMNLSIMKVGASGQVRAGTTDLLAHRVKFSVPILLPGMPVSGQSTA